MDLPVGRRLQDKYGATFGHFIVKEGYSFRRDRDITISSATEWLTNGTGVISGARTEAIYMRKSEFGTRKDRSDLHTYVTSIVLTNKLV